MLEKVFGIIDTKKLREILLLEADFNTLHNIIFNRRVIPILEYFKGIPLKFIGRGRI